MIDSQQLQDLGWSKELIDAVTRVAESLRVTHGMIDDVCSPSGKNSFVAGSAIYSDCLVKGSTQEITIKQPS
jgi:hypothetical protein